MHMLTLVSRRTMTSTPLISKQIEVRDRRAAKTHSDESENVALHRILLLNVVARHTTLFGTEPR